MGDRLSRWVSANRRFLGVVGAGALCLLVLHWLFVSGPRKQYRSGLKSYSSSVSQLTTLYRSDDTPTDGRLRQLTAARDEQAAAVRRLATRIGAPPAGAFLPPRDEPNYYFKQRAAVLAELTEAATNRAVNVRVESLGLPEQAPGEALVADWLWHMQTVRRGVLAAVAAGVDEVRGAQVFMDKARQKHEASQSGATLIGSTARGTPITMEVEGSIAACAAWLEALQRDDGFLVLVQARVRRDEKATGGTVASATLMGVRYDPPSESAPEQP